MLNDLSDYFGDDLVKMSVKYEVLNIPAAHDYDLSEFYFDKTVDETGATVLSFISKLIFNRKIS